jgi:CRP-like cAMP-binding protein
MFQQTDPKFLQELFRNNPKRIEITSGETLFREGDTGDVMYVLLEGAAAVTIGGVLFEELSPGSIVGEMSVVDGSPRFGTVTAHTPCNFAVVNREHFRFLVQEVPDFSLEIMRILIKRLKQCDLRVIHATTAGQHK